MTLICFQLVKIWWRKCIFYLSSLLILSDTSMNRFDKFFRLVVFFIFVLPEWKLTQVKKQQNLLHSILATKSKSTRFWQSTDVFLFLWRRHRSVTIREKKENDGGFSFSVRLWKYSNSLRDSMYWVWPTKSIEKKKEKTDWEKEIHVSHDDECMQIGPLILCLFSFLRSLYVIIEIKKSIKLKIRLAFLNETKKKMNNNGQKRLDAFGE